MTRILRRGISGSLLIVNFSSNKITKSKKINEGTQDMLRRAKKTSLRALLRHPRFIPVIDCYNLQQNNRLEYTETSTCLNSGNWDLLQTCTLSVLCLLLVCMESCPYISIP